MYTYILCLYCGYRVLTVKIGAWCLVLPACGKSTSYYTSSFARIVARFANRVAVSRCRGRGASVSSVRLESYLGVAVRVDNRSISDYVPWDKIIYKENRKENIYSDATRRGSGQLRSGESFCRHQRLNLKKISLTERDLDAR